MGRLYQRRLVLMLGLGLATLAALPAPAMFEPTKAPDIHVGLWKWTVAELRRAYPCKFKSAQLINARELYLDDKYAYLSILFKAEIVIGPDDLRQFAHLHVMSFTGGPDGHDLIAWNNNVTRETILEPFEVTVKVPCPTGATEPPGTPAPRGLARDAYKTNRFYEDLKRVYPCPIKEIHFIRSELGRHFKYQINKALVKTEDFGCHYIHFYIHHDGPPSTLGQFDNRVKLDTPLNQFPTTFAASCQAVRLPECDMNITPIQ